MLKLISVSFVLLLLFCSGCFAAVPVSFSWDASLTPSTADNPIRYWLYVCTDSQLTNCVQNDADTALTVTVPLASGNYWAFVTARNYGVSADNPDGLFVGIVQESDKSNILPVRVSVPAGNPLNFRVKVK